MIKLIVSIFHSRRDIYGNCYWAFRARDTASGKSCEGKISGGESNITSCWEDLGLKSEEVHYTVNELPIRQFNRETKDFAYAGCPPRKIALFIKECLGWAIGHETYRVVAVEHDERLKKFKHYCVSESRAYKVYFDREFPLGTTFDTVDQDFEDKGSSYPARRITEKLFKIATVSENANAFGLYGHVLVALDGEAWEVARARGEWLTGWNKGSIIETSGDNWAAHNCEIPRRLPNAPQGVVKEVWGY